ncbi:hypothetical protein [Escherichia coli]|uniref:hypothetical protein n=1 Tax=Escherichia coli TaxID=562 RepID=UPI00208DBC39|nr:hypothetical protein [Escherichia coli]
MNINTETREILRNYRAVINARRREMGQKPLTTAQIVDEICDFVVNQQAVFLGAYSALFDHGLASKSDQRFASIRSTGNLTFSTAF